MQTDWMSTFIGAFLGFGFALLVEFIMTRYSSKKTEKDVLEKIASELDALLADLKNYTTLPTYFRYQCDVWEMSINSGHLLSISSNLKYDKFIEVYSKINFANALEKSYFDLKMLQAQSSNDKDNLIANTIKKFEEERIERKNQIVEDIQKILQVR